MLYSETRSLPRQSWTRVLDPPQSTAEHTARNYSRTRYPRASRSQSSSQADRRYKRSYAYATELPLNEREKKAYLKTVRKRCKGKPINQRSKKLQAFLTSLLTYLTPTVAATLLCAVIATAAYTYQRAMQALPSNVRTQVQGLADMIVQAIEQKYRLSDVGSALKKQEAM